MPVSVVARSLLFTFLLIAFSSLPASASRTRDKFDRLCKVNANGSELLETCSVEEVREGQWRIGLRVVARLAKYEYRSGVFSMCKDERLFWDSTSRVCSRFEWVAEPLPGRTKKCFPAPSGEMACPMNSDDSLIKISPQLSVQGLTFG